MSNAAGASARVRRAYEDLLSGVTPASDSVRPVVRESWARSMSNGIDPGEPRSGDVDAAMSADDFAEYRRTHPISAVRPMVQSLMLDDIADSGVLVALTDQMGRLLWVEGSTQARERASNINFVEGSVWSEDVVGTNAPGLALAVDRGVQVIGPEHFAGSVQEWSCAAAPVHDPVTGHVIGVVDVTGGREVAAPFALAAVRSVVAAVERELQQSISISATSAMRGVDLGDPATFAPAGPASSGAVLEVLGGHGYRWRTPAGVARTVSRRHAEILLLLQMHPEGLNTEQLALALAEDGLDPVTVRAEISRMRRDLGSEVVASRPYRLTAEPASDVSRLRAQVASGGDLGGVIESLGRGGLLAESTAPGIVELFEEICEDIRSRAIAEGDPAVLRAWTSSVHGRDDLQAWRRLEHRLPPGHPERAVVGGRIRLLDKRYGMAT